MVSTYPAALDTRISLPTQIDNLSPVRGEAVNILRDTLLRIEYELGVKPSGVYGTVRERLDELEKTIFGQDGAGAVIASGSAQQGEALIWNGTSWAPGNNFFSRAIQTTGSAQFGQTNTSSLTTALLSLSGKLILKGITTSYVSNTGEGVIYYDSGTNHFMVSENGGAYTQLGSGGGGGFTAGGDLSGTSSNQTVIRLRTVPVSATSPTTNQVLEYDGSAWAPADLPTIPSSLPPNGSAGGDLTSTYPNPTVAAIQGTPVSGTGPTTNQVLEYNGSAWAPANLPSSLPPTGSASGDLSGTYPNPTVVKLQNIDISSNTPDDGYVLTYEVSSTSWKPLPSAGGGGDGTTISITAVSAPYSALSTDVFIAVATGGGTITLEASPVIGRILTINDVDGNAFTNNLIIDGSGNNINGSSTYTIAINYGSVELVFTGSRWSVK